MARDDFPPRIRKALALRSGYICSIENCGKATAGPSEEAPDAVTMIGVAAHICAASPGGARYDPSMTLAQRSDITNGIWVCRDHGTIIDDDVVRFTGAVLREMKRKHEASKSFALGSQSAATADDIIAIGDSIIGVGEFVGVDPFGWKAKLKHFVIGDANELVSYASDFAIRPAEDRYVLVSALGDGRVLSGAPAITRRGSEHEIVFPIGASFPRTRAQDIGSTTAESPETHDLYVENGNIARVAGLAALPQNIKTSLGLAMGESPVHQRWGSRISQFYRDFANTRWLDRLIKMEVIRLSAIPLVNQMNGSTHTPLQCVDRVLDAEVLADAPTNQRLPIRMTLDVHGVGRWQQDIRVFIHTDEQLKVIAGRHPGWFLMG